MKNPSRLSFFAILALLLTAALAACGDATSTTAPATTAPAATTAAATTAPATTAATTTSVATTSAATTAATTAAATTTTATTGAATTAAATTSTSGGVTYPLTVTDGSGASVTLAKKPEKIVCLTEACLDAMVELGLPAPIAVTDLFYGAAVNSRLYGDAAKNIGRIPYKGDSIDLELLASFKPDLVVDSEGQGTPRDAVKNIAPLYVLDSVKDIPTAITMLKDFARIVDRSAQAETAAKHLTDKVAAYKAKSPRDVSLVIMANYTDGPNQYISTPSQPICAALNEVVKCGIEAPPVYVGYAQISVEAILQADPQVIIANTVLGSPKGAYQDSLVASQEAARTALLSNTFWKNLSAVKNNKIYDVDRTVWYPTSGTRSLGIALDDVMTKVYPQLFPTPLP
ncbi:MAG: ABC transporter substrate-binding protein [Chloroflexi bacterium]|nr:ABC transporter substrate-binding protein [Chloroflexota bacterium]